MFQGQSKHRPKVIWVVSPGYKAVKEEFNLVKEVLFVSCEDMISVNHTNNGAAEDIGCVAAGRGKIQIEILWLFKDFSSDVACGNGNLQIHEGNRVRTV